MLGLMLFMCCHRELVWSRDCPDGNMWVNGNEMIKPNNRIMENAMNICIMRFLATLSNKLSFWPKNQIGIYKTIESIYIESHEFVNLFL